MAGIGNDLVVNLAGNNKKLKSSIAESKGGLKGFASSAVGFLNPVVAGFAAVAGGAIAAGVAVYGLTANIAKLDKVAKDAARTGISGAFLQQLTFAADQSGVAADKVIDALKDMTIKIGQASSGNVALVASFEQLGLSVTDLKTMSPEKQFRTIFENISKLPTAAQRSAAAVTAFGEAGHQMTTLFSGGLKGLNGLLERATELGIGVDAEGLKKIEAANDAIGQMKASFGALLDQVTVGLAPAFEYIGTTIADMIPPVTELFAKFNGLNDKAQFLGDILDASMSVAFESIKANWDLMLGEMIISATNAGKKIAMNLDPGTAVARYIGGKVGKASGGPDAAPGQTKLDAAKQNLDNVLARLDAVKPFVPQGPQAPMADDGSKLKGLFGSITESAGPLIEGMKAKIGQEIGAAKLTGNWFVKSAQNLWGGDKIKDPKATKKEEQATKIETQFAGAMQKGSAEAYSTIVAAMRGNKDPQVKAIDKSTKAIVAAVKANKPANNKVIGAFA